MPATEITHVISQVTFPAYSKLQYGIPKLRETYLRVLQVTAFLSFPIAGLIFVLGSDFAKIFLGEKWMPMVPAVQVLCVLGITRSIGATMEPILSRLAKPKIQTKLSSIQLIPVILGVNDSPHRGYANIKSSFKKKIVHLIDRISYHLSNGTGYSAKEIIEEARNIIGEPIPSIITERRLGNPAVKTPRRVSVVTGHEANR